MPENDAKIERSRKERFLKCFLVSRTIHFAKNAASFCCGRKRRSSCFLGKMECGQIILVLCKQRVGHFFDLLQRADRAAKRIHAYRLENLAPVAGHRPYHRKNQPTAYGTA